MRGARALSLEDDRVSSREVDEKFHCLVRERGVGGGGYFNNTDIPHQECKGRHEKLYLKHIVTSRNDMLGSNIETSFAGSQWIKLDNETVRAISTTGRGVK